MNKSKRSAVAAIVLMLASVAGWAGAAIITQPPGFNAGDQYRLVFVTSATRNAQTASVGPFNDFVTAQANAVPELAALGTSWEAIVSSRTFGANENTNTGGPGGGSPGEGVPIFRLDGLNVAVDYGELWDGSINNAIQITERGTPLSVGVSTFVWSGSTSNGDPSPNRAIGDSAIRVGIPNRTDLEWITALTVFGDPMVLSPDWQNHVYAMSGVLTAVPEPGTTGDGVVPEAGSLAIWTLLAGGGLLLRRRDGGRPGSFHPRRHDPLTPPSNMRAPATMKNDGSEVNDHLPAVSRSRAWTSRTFISDWYGTSRWLASVFSRVTSDDGMRSVMLSVENLRRGISGARTPLDKSRWSVLSEASSGT